MALNDKGIYFVDKNTPYDYEAQYYLNFQIYSALQSLEFLYSKPDTSMWKNKYQYYHYYTDHLMFSVGQIANRFIITSKDKGLKRDLKKSNRQNFRFSENKYPILSKKGARNTIEHIDERNQNTIRENQGVGGFCLIDTDTDPELVKRLQTKRATQPYTLDLINKELLIRNKNDDLVISLEDLKAELTTLQKSVDALFAIIVR